MKLKKLLNFVASVPFEFGTVQNKRTFQKLSLFRSPKSGILVKDSTGTHLLETFQVSDTDEWRAELAFQNAEGRMTIDLEMIEGKEASVPVRSVTLLAS